MRTMIRISAVLAMALLLVSAPLLSQGFGLETADQHTPGAVLASDSRTSLICAYQAERSVPEYYRGRAGQLERRGGRTDTVNRGRLVCKSPAGDVVRIFSNCRF